MSKYVVAGGTHTRIEDNRSVTYAAGQEIKVTEEERKAFPGKFKLVETPRTAEEESQVAKLQAEVKALETQLKEQQDQNRKLEEAKYIPVKH
jgi:hypothetical protein